LNELTLGEFKKSRDINSQVTLDVFLVKKVPMQLRNIVVIGCWLISGILWSQNDRIRVNIGEGVNPWSGLDVNNNTDQFQFIVVTDRTGGHRPGVFEEAVRKINLLQPEFVMSVGDLIEGYTEDTSILKAEWDEFTGFIDSLQMPFFYVPGNHDLTNAVQEREYLKRFGKTYYHFIYKDVLFLCLNSEDQLRGAGRGTISEPQFEYIKETLLANQEVKYTFLFLHQPLWIQDDPQYWSQVEALLEDRPHTVFAGHYHHYVKRDRNNGKYFMLATTGGGSRLRGKDFGEFDHVVWVTMTQAGPVVANLWLKGIWDENVSTENTESFIDQLMTSQVVQFEPVFTGDGAEVDPTFKIKLSNHLDVPLNIQIEEGFGWDVWVRVDTHQVELHPNSVEWITGHFSLRKQEKSLEELRPTPVRFIVSAELPDGSTLEIPVPINVKPLSKSYIDHTSIKVSVDGMVNEWDQWSGTLTTTSDNQLRYQLAYDASHLYIAAAIDDDTLVLHPDNSITRQDNLRLQLAFGPAVKSSKSPVDSYSIRITPATTKTPSMIQQAERIPADWKYLCKATSAGYAFELAIPLEYLNRAQGGDWKSLRLNWFLDDLDDHDNWRQIQRNALYPAWGSDAEILGSGTYFKAEK